MIIGSSLLPPVQNAYRGSPYSLYFLVVIGLLDTLRSCVHYFAPDGGSGIIAGLPLESYSHDAVMTIVNAFGVFGIGHILQTILLWTVVFRCREWIPFMYLLLFVGKLLGVVLFIWKPLPVVPPGQVGIYLMLPLIFGFMLLSIREKETSS